MPTRDTAPIGAPCWVDLATSDADRARAFYSEVLGWSAEEPEPEFGGYFNYTRDGTRVAGCVPIMPDSDVEDVWSVYLATDDAARTVDAAAAGGGKVVVTPMQVGDLGTMAVITDVAGARVGVWQPGRHPGFTVYGEAGTPGWFELHTRDHDGSVRFYRDVFRWDTQALSDDMQMRYTVVHHGDEHLAGVLDASGALSEGEPSHWTVYFAVPDTDAALAAVERLGGSVGRPAEDTPYGLLAEVADPMGARFMLVGPNESMPAGGASD